MTKLNDLIANAKIKYLGQIVRKVWGGQLVNHYRLFAGGQHFDYYSGLACKAPNAKDIFTCIAQDMQAIAETHDISDFLCEFGYNESPEKMRNGKRIFAEILQEQRKVALMGLALDELQTLLDD